MHLRGIARWTGSAALALAGVSVGTLPAHTQVRVDVGSVDAAKAMIAAGRVDEARHLLESLNSRTPQDNEIEFLLGLLAMRVGEHNLAIRHFRSILVREPEAVRVRLELARALYADRQYENAYRQFQFARAGTSSPAVIGNIDRFLAAIRLEKSWSYDVTIALAPDTNINNATSASETTLFGLPFELDESARRKSGVGLAIGASAEIAPRVAQRVRLRLGAAARRREYGGSEFDDTLLSLHAGPRLVLPRWDLSVVLTGFRRIYGDRLLTNGVGARAEGFHQLDGRTGISFGASAQLLRYPHSPDQTGMNLAAWTGVTRALTPASSLSPHAAVSRHAAHADSQAYWWGKIGVGYYRDFPGGFSAYLEPSVSLTRYDATDPLFGGPRRDWGQEMQVALLNRRIVLSRFTPRVTYTLTRRRSTIELFDFTQHRVEVGLTSTF